MNEANDIMITISLYFEVRDSEAYGGKGSIGYVSTNVDFKASALAKVDFTKFTEAQKQGVAKMLKVDEEKVLIISRGYYENEDEDEDEEEIWSL